LTTLLGNSWRVLRWLLARMPGVVKNRKNRLVHKASSLPSRMDDNAGVPIQQIVINRFSRFASKTFHPRPLDASGVLIRAESWGDEMLPGHDLTNGWRDLFVRGLEIVQARGDHLSMVSDENAAALGRQINTVLDRYGLGHRDERPACAIRKAPRR
jgi:thioesterase domain-containing protein